MYYNKKQRANTVKIMAGRNPTKTRVIGSK